MFCYYVLSALDIAEGEMELYRQVAEGKQERPCLRLPAVGRPAALVRPPQDQHVSRGLNLMQAEQRRVPMSARSVNDLFSSILAYDVSSQRHN